MDQSKDGTINLRYAANEKIKRHLLNTHFDIFAWKNWSYAPKAKKQSLVAILISCTTLEYSTAHAKSSSTATSKSFLAIHLMIFPNFHDSTYIHSSTIDPLNQFGNQFIFAWMCIRKCFATYEKPLIWSLYELIKLLQCTRFTTWLLIHAVDGWTSTEATGGP